MDARDEIERLLREAGTEPHQPRRHAPEAGDDDVHLDEEMLAEVDAAARRAMALRHRLAASPSAETGAGGEDAGSRAPIVAKAADVAASGGKTFWARLDEAHRVELLSMAAAREFAARQPLFHAGETANGAFVIVDGWARIIAPSLAGHEGVTVAVRGPGELVGEGGALCGIPRSATVQALGGGLRALEVPGELFSAFLEANPPVARLVERIIWRRMRDANELSTSITIASGERRLASVVGNLAEWHREVTSPPPATPAGSPAGGGAEDAPVTLPITVMDLASMSALPLGTVEDITRKWKASGILRPGTVDISVQDIPALREVHSGPPVDDDGEFEHSRQSLAVRACQWFQQFQADVLEEIERIPEHSAPGSSG